MTSKERKLWEQAVRVLKQNSVAVKVPAEERVRSLSHIKRVVEQSRGDS